MNLPGAPRQNCLLLKLSVTSTTPGMCRGGVWTRMAWEVISSLHTSIVPNSTCTTVSGNQKPFQFAGLFSCPLFFT